MKIEIKKRSDTIREPSPPYYIVKNKYITNFRPDILYLRKDSKWHETCTLDGFFSKHEAIEFVLEYIGKRSFNRYDIIVDSKLLVLPDINFITEEEMKINS